MDDRESSSAEKERRHLLIIRYKEEKIFKELERIEQERQQLHMEKVMKR